MQISTTRITSQMKDFQTHTSNKNYLLQLERKTTQVISKAKKKKSFIVFLVEKKM